MQHLLVWATLLSTAHGLFFNLGGGGGGCSCPSSCGSPPPANIGCRMMCVGQQMSCQQQQSFAQFAQQPVAQPNFGIPAAPIPQSSYQQVPPVYNSYPAPALAYNYQQQQPAYARPQFTSFGQQPRVVAPQPTSGYVPPGPTRFVDNYASSLNRITSGYGPQAPVAPPVYSQQQTTNLLVPHQPTNLLPASFVSNPQAVSPGQPAETQEVNLLPPAEPGSEVQQQGTNYVTHRPIESYGRAATTDFSISIKESEKQTPDEIVKSIEESYDDVEDQSEQKEVTASVPEDIMEVLTNQVTVRLSPVWKPLQSANYVTAATSLHENDENEEEIEMEVETKTVSTPEAQYIQSNIAPVKAEVPQAIVTTTASAGYKTLTRAEGLSSTYHGSPSEFSNQSEIPVTTESANDIESVTEDYAEEDSTDNHVPEDIKGKEEDNDSGPYNKKYRLQKLAIDKFFDTTLEPTTDLPPAKRSQGPDHQAFKCNSAKLRNIMEEKMTVSAPVSKQLIYAEATSQFPGLALDVICSRHSFSYIVVTSPIYCEHRKSPLTCFAFFQP